MESQTEVSESSQVDFADRPLPKRDIKRLAKEPFATRYAPLEEQTRDALRGWTPPREAYVLFERWSIELVSDAEKRTRYTTFTFNVEARPEQFHKIEFYIRKGYRILHWGNFHFLTDKDEESVKLAQLHKNAWQRLENELIRTVENSVNAMEANKLKDLNAALAAENSALLQKVREYEEAAKKAATAPGSAKKGKEE